MTTPISDRLSCGSLRNHPPHSWLGQHEPGSDTTHQCPGAGRLDLNELAAEIHKTALDHGWWSKPVKEWNFAEDLMLIVSEASEALEDWRKGYEVSVPGYEYVQSTEPLEYKPVGIPSELADILIRVLDVSVAYGVDIQAAVSEKIAYNKTRSYRHGGKRT